jgi:hypothetical protein
MRRIEETYRLRLFDISLVSPEAKDSSDHATHRRKTETIPAALEID